MSAGDKTPVKKSDGWVTVNRRNVKPKNLKQELMEAEMKETEKKFKARSSIVTAQPLRLEEIVTPGILQMAIPKMESTHLDLVPDWPDQPDPKGRSKKKSVIKEVEIDKPNTENTKKESSDNQLEKKTDRTTPDSQKTGEDDEKKSSDNSSEKKADVRFGLTEFIILFWSMNGYRTLSTDLKYFLQTAVLCHQVLSSKVDI